MNTIYCDNDHMSYTLTTGNTSYLAYRIGQGSETMTISLSVQQGNTTIAGTAVVVDPLKKQTTSTAVLVCSAAIMGRIEIDTQQLNAHMLFTDSADPIDEGALLIEASIPYPNHWSCQSALGVIFAPDHMVPEQQGVVCRLFDPNDRCFG